MGKAKFTPEYKAGLVIENLKGKTVSEISAREGVPRAEIQMWKKEFLDNAGRIFTLKQESREAKAATSEIKEREKEMSGELDRLAAEQEWLKKIVTGSISKKERLRLARSTEGISISRRCDLLDVNRASVYYMSGKKGK